MPAPIGNTNAQTHGARKRSVALDGSGLPKGCGKDELRTRLLRRMVEAELSRIHNGKPPLYLLALAGTVARHEARCRLLSRYLRTEDKLTLSERMTLLREITDAAEARDRLLAKLIGDSSAAPASIWDALNEPESRSSPIQATGRPNPTEVSTEAPAGPQRGGEKRQQDVTPLGPPIPQPNEALALLMPDGDAHHAEPVSKDSPTGQEAAALLSQAGGSAAGNRPPEEKASEGEAA